MDAEERGWPSTLPVDLWEDVTESTIGVNSHWTNMVELADVNEDSLVDVLSAIGVGNDDPQPPEFSRIYLNQGPGTKFHEATKGIFGPSPLGIARVIKVRDVNDDGHVDVLVGLTFETESRLFLGQGEGRFLGATGTHFPRLKASVDDLELGDMDGDGDLDVVLCVWGPGNPKTNEGGRTMLWLNDGEGRFTDATETQMPETSIKFPWELELVDIDNDYDLDVLVAPWKDQTSYLFENDGHGKLTDVTKGRLSLSANNFDFEAIDLTGDGYLDLITINTGELLVGPQEPRRDQILANDRSGGFVNASSELWPDEENFAYDDNASVFLDYDSDGDADVLIAALTGPDRLLINDGAGRLKQAPGVFPESGRPPSATDLSRDLGGQGSLWLYSLHLSRGSKRGQEARRGLRSGGNPESHTVRPFRGQDLFRVGHRPGHGAAQYFSRREDRGKGEGAFRARPRAR